MFIFFHLSTRAKYHTISINTPRFSKYPIFNHEHEPGRLSAMLEGEILASKCLGNALLNTCPPWVASQPYRSHTYLSGAHQRNDCWFGFATRLTLKTVLGPVQQIMSTNSMLLTGVGRKDADMFTISDGMATRFLEEDFLTHVLVHILFQRSHAVSWIWSTWLMGVSIDPSRIDEKSPTCITLDHNSSYYRLG
jgi:hypothetical protein